MGRPSEYTAETADYICEQLAEGKSLRQICAEDGMPAVGTVFVWLKKYMAFQEQYTRAREVQGHVAAEDAVDGALTAYDPQLGRLRYDALKWRASKLVPKVYGDKIQAEHSGPNGGPIASLTITATDPVEAAREYQRLIRGE